MFQYAIWACDNLYGGLHGMNYQGVINADSENDALDYAREMAFELLHSYECIEDELEQDVNELITDNMTEDEIEEIRLQVYEEDVEYLVKEIEKEGYDTHYLDNLIYDLGFEEFCEKFC